MIADLIPLNGWGSYGSILVAQSYFGRLMVSEAIAQALRPGAVLILLALLMLVPADAKIRPAALGAIAAAATVELFFFVAALIQVQNIAALWVGVVGCLLVVGGAAEALREEFQRGKSLSLE
ncbi:MAG: hypothetical protein M3290_05295 [Actinomycetota bacterium]|nr:hypothetical protein [Actinomycetota bacterium]